MNTNKSESLSNLIPVSGSVPENIFSHYKAEQDNNESNNDYQTLIVRAQLNGQTITDSIDFNIPLTDPSSGITEFHRSFFTIWLNFRIYTMSTGNVIAGIPVKPDGIPAWLDHFEVNLTKRNTKWYKDPACINIAKNQFIFIGYNNSTDCFSQVMIKSREIDVPDTLTDNYTLRNYLPNVVKSKAQKENKRGEYTLWENVQKHDPSICETYISY
jgi:hypothetical protein